MLFLLVCPLYRQTQGNLLRRNNKSIWKRHVYNRNWAIKTSAAKKDNFADNLAHLPLSLGRCPFTNRSIPSPVVTTNTSVATPRTLPAIFSATRICERSSAERQTSRTNISCMIFSKQRARTHISRTRMKKSIQLFHRSCPGCKAPLLPCVAGDVPQLTR